jgi:hypothetical protein
MYGWYGLSKYQCEGSENIYGGIWAMMSDNNNTYGTYL